MTGQVDISGFILFQLLILCVPDLSTRVDAVKEENLKLKSENQVLGQYIENLMSASSVFQTTDTKSKRKWGALGGEKAEVEGPAAEKGNPPWRHKKGFVFSAGLGVFCNGYCSLTWV